MGVSKRKEISDARKKQCIDIYTKLNGDISTKDLGELVGVTDQMASYYIRCYFKTIRGNKF